MNQTIQLKLDNGNFASRINQKMCLFELTCGDKLILSWRDCLEIFCTVADNMPPDFDRDGIFYQMLDKLGLEE